MERYYLTRGTDTPGYRFEVREVTRHNPELILELQELDHQTYAEPTFSRFTLGAILRHGRVFLAMADEVVIGACHCLRSYAETDEVVIFNMALRPGWRGHGLGTRFLERVLELLAHSGVRAVVLQVATSNQRAITVYRDKFHFEVIAEHPDEYANGQPYLMMRLPLPTASNQ